MAMDSRTVRCERHVARKCDNLKEKDYFGGLGVGGGYILKHLQNEQDVMLKTAPKWLRIVSSGMLLPSVSTKRGELTDQLSYCQFLIKDSAPWSYR
jgi:hypothetical protein